MFKDHREKEEPSKDLRIITKREHLQRLCWTSQPAVKIAREVQLLEVKVELSNLAKPSQLGSLKKKSSAKM